MKLQRQHLSFPPLPRPTLFLPARVESRSRAFVEEVLQASGILMK